MNKTLDTQESPSPASHFQETANLVNPDPLETILAKVTNGKSDLSANEMLIYALSEDLLDLKDLQDLCKVMQQNSQIHFTVYDGLSHSKNTSIKLTFLGCIILRFVEVSFSGLSDDYEVIYSMVELCKKPEQLLYEFFYLYWQTLSDPRHTWFSEAFITTIGLVSDQKKLTEAHKIYMLLNCVEKLEIEGLAVSCIKIMRKILGSYPKVPNKRKEMTESDCIYLLCEDHDLLNKVILDLKLFVDENMDSISSKAFDKTTELDERLQFIAYLTYHVRALSCEVLSGLWEITIAYGSFEPLQKPILKMLRRGIESIHGQSIKPEVLIRFFRETIDKDNILKVSEEGFKCFRIIFVIVNHSLQNISKVLYLTTASSDPGLIFETLKMPSQNLRMETEGFEFVVRKVPQKLEGHDLLWKLAFLAEDNTVAKRARDLLVYLYTNLNLELCSQIKEIREEFLKRCFGIMKECSLLGEGETSTIKIIRCLEIVHSIIDEIDKDNPLRPKLHCELGKGELVCVKIIKKKAVPWNHEIKCYSNTMVCELFSNFNIKKDEFQGYFGSSMIINLQNSRTLLSLGIQNNTSITIEPILPPEVYLIQHNGKLNPKAVDIFTKWFEEYSDNGKMDPQQCSAFAFSCGVPDRNPSGSKIAEIFRDYDNDKDGFLTLDNFLAFYRKSCKKLPDIVWNDLRGHGIPSDLQPLKKKAKAKETNASLHIVSLIAANNDHFSLLFSLLDSEEDQIAVKALELLDRLPTNPDIFADIVMLKGVRDVSDCEKRDWSHVLDTKRKYRMFYCLNIIGYLIDNKAFDNYKTEDMKALWSQDPQLLEYKSSWVSDFSYYGGFRHLEHAIHSLHVLEPSPMVNTYLARANALINTYDDKEA